jgi:hypothetical protein
MRIRDSAGKIGRPPQNANQLGWVMDRDAIAAELLEIEALFQDERLKDENRCALYGAQQALRHILDRDTWHTASQTFYRLDARPIELGSLLVH